MKLSTSIQHVRGHCRKHFKVIVSKVKVTQRRPKKA